MCVIPGPKRTYRWVIDRIGGAAPVAALLMVGLGVWGLLSGWRGLEPGTLEHVLISLVLGALTVTIAVRDHRARKRLDRLQRETRQQSAIAHTEALVMAAEARRLLPKARAGYARRCDKRGHGHQILENEQARGSDP